MKAVLIFVVNMNFSFGYTVESMSLSFFQGKYTEFDV